MARAYNARCLVIKHTKLGETDSIVTMLSDEGAQIRAVAKGLRKPGNRIGARLQLFSEVDLLLHAGRNLDVVGEVKTVRANADLREGLERPALASIVVELLEKLGRDGAGLEARMYAMSVAALRRIAELDIAHAELIVAAFLFKAMAMLGFAPAVRECAICGQPVRDARVFDVSHGGVLCDDCASRLGMRGGVDPAIAAWVESALYCTFDEMEPIEDAPVAELLDLAQTWIREHLGLNLKSIVFYKSVMR